MTALQYSHSETDEEFQWNFRMQPFQGTLYASLRVYVTDSKPDISHPWEHHHIEKSLTIKATLLCHTPIHYSLDKIEIFGHLLHRWSTLSVAHVYMTNFYDWFLHKNTTFAVWVQSIYIGAVANWETTVNWMRHFAGLCFLWISHLAPARVSLLVCAMLWCPLVTGTGRVPWRGRWRMGMQGSAFGRLPEVGLGVRPCLWPGPWDVAVGTSGCKCLRLFITLWRGCRWDWLMSSKWPWLWPWGDHRLEACWDRPTNPWYEWLLPRGWAGCDGTGRWPAEAGSYEMPGAHLASTDMDLVLV